MLTSTLPRWPGDAEPEFILDLTRVINDRHAVDSSPPVLTCLTEINSLNRGRRRDEPVDKS